MKVLHVTGDYGLGGVETFLATLAEHRGACPSMEPEFLMFKAGYLGERLATLNATVHSLGEVHLRWPKRVFEARRAFRRVLGRQKFEVVVFHHYAWMPLILDGIARAARCRRVRWFHNEADKQDWRERALRTLQPGFPDLTIYNSAFTARSVAYSDPSEILYYPVKPSNVRLSASERAAVRRECQTPDDAVVIIQVSRMGVRKGHRQHLQALALLPDESNWVCWMVGGAQTQEQEEYFAALKTLANSLGIADRVRFLGNRTDVRRQLAAADIFCQPNMPPPEPFGISVVEALYAGLPVVGTSALGGALELLGESTSIILPAGDVPKLAEALKRLIDDHGLRRAFSESGPTRAKELCDPPTQVAKLGVILQRLAYLR